jgi:thymidylate synthase ThyX
MKVTQVSICPTQASKDAGKPALTPELLAASGARYSRNNEGLDAIISKIDPDNPDASVDSIFKMLDYGHASIADMAPVAIFMDKISIFMAYYLWSVCPTAGGQESSTRYVNYNESLPDFDELGIPEDQREDLQNYINESFEQYNKAIEFWERVGRENPEMMKIPASVLNDNSEMGVKKKERMIRNFAFDRSRYFIPSCCETNMMMVMSARGWSQLCTRLLSHYLPEANKLGQLIVDELNLVVPRVTKHATEKPSYYKGIRQEFDDKVRYSCDVFDSTRGFDEDFFSPDGDGGFWSDVTTGVEEKDLAFHDNRYAYIGDSIRMTPVRFWWTRVSFAEIRDFNRHRTGEKFCSLIPVGFYGAQEQAIELGLWAAHKKELSEIVKVGKRHSKKALQKLQESNPFYIYFTSLGTEFHFEHVTTADKFIYEVELRTGVGAHYRYAHLLRETMKRWYAKYPETKGLILEGSAEPE